MRDHTKLRGIEESALSGSLEDTPAFSLKPKQLSFFMEKKVALMNQYLSITRIMKETFMLKNEIKLGDLLSKRQDCINRIKKIDLSVQKAINPGTEEFSSVSNDLKASFDNYLRSIKRLIEQIAPIDAEVMLMVKEESRGIKTELLKICNARQAAKGYSSKEKRIPVYMDARR